MWYVQHGSTFSSVEYTVQIDPSKVGVERIHFVRSHLKFDEPKPRSLHMRLPMARNGGGCRFLWHMRLSQ